MEGDNLKIGILTASRTDNNGTDLQALAMQLLFSTTGNTVELINYKCEKLENSRKVFYPKTLRGFLQIPWNIHNHREHEKFRKAFFSYSQKVYDKSNIDDNDYNLIVVGSDQIWNLQITGNDLSFFIPYIKDEQKKYSYAASIGKTNIQSWEREYSISKYLAKFSGVSVREKSGVDALHDIGIEARYDLDPLLMINREVWNQYKCVQHHKQPYVFVYVVDRTKEAVQFAKDYAKKHNLDVIFYGNPIKPISGVKVVRFANMQKWIDYVANAELVVTNSYHCLSFTVTYHRIFSLFWLENSVQSNTRLKNLLDVVGIDEYEEATVCSPDWLKADMLLDKRRSDSFKYIHSMIVGD